MVSVREGVSPSTPFLRFVLPCVECALKERSVYMAIYHCTIKIGSRSNGQSAIAAAAYRSGSKLYENETGLSPDYTKKKGVVFSEISLCENAPREYQDRATLWNAVQKIESAKNSRLWREIEVALPKEFSREQQIEVVRKFVSKLTEQGMCADWSIHDKDKEIPNPHAHIMLTTRSILNNGEWAPKSKKVYDLDENGERIFQKVDKSGRKQYKSHKEDYNDWNATERVEEWRTEWEIVCNELLPEQKKIDHRSYERQGIDKIPTIHEGYAAREMERRGEVSERAEYNRAVRAMNAYNEEIRAEDKMYAAETNLVSKKWEDIRAAVKDKFTAEKENERSIENIVSEIVKLRNEFYYASYLYSQKDQKVNMEKIEREKVLAKAEPAAEQFLQETREVRELNKEMAEKGTFALKAKSIIKTKLKQAVSLLRNAAKILEDKLGIPITFGTMPLNFDAPDKHRSEQIYEQAKKNISEIRREASAERSKIALLEQASKVTPEYIQSKLGAFAHACEDIPADLRQEVAAKLQNSKARYETLDAKIKVNRVLADNLHIVQHREREQAQQLQNRKKGGQSL